MSAGMSYTMPNNNDIIPKKKSMKFMDGLYFLVLGAFLIYILYVETEILNQIGFDFKYDCWMK